MSNDADRIAELEAENRILQQQVINLTSCLRIVEGAVGVALDQSRSNNPR